MIAQVNSPLNISTEVLSPISIPRTPVAVRIQQSLSNIVTSDIKDSQEYKRVRFDSLNDYDVNMAKVVCDTFSGYPHENAATFSSQFDSY